MSGIRTRVPQSADVLAVLHAAGISAQAWRPVRPYGQALAEVEHALISRARIALTAAGYSAGARDGRFAGAGPALQGGDSACPGPHGGDTQAC